MTNELVIIISVLMVLNFLFVFNFNKISILVNIFDNPNERKKHTKPIAPLGGLILFINILCIYVLFKILELDIAFLSIILLSSLSLMFFLGLTDDIKNFSSNLKFLLFIFIIIVHLFLENGYIIKSLHLDFIDYKINLNFYQGILFTLLCILLFVNASNLYDGINLQSGLYFIFIFCYLIFKNPSLDFMKLCLIPLFFFLFLNFRNICFFGDSGTLLVSYMTSLIIIDQHLNQNSLMISEILLLMIVPGLDMFRLFIKRIILKKNPFEGDRKHIHHILVKKLNLLNSNIILMSLNMLPIVLYNFFPDYFISILIFLVIIYFYIVITLDK